MSDHYFTIPDQASAEIKVKGSRFIANVIPTDSPDAVDSALTRIRKQYYDATHNCYAWQTGRDNDISFKYSDDGEPSGTAGKPIYDCIVGRTLTDLLLVVTRYFGGTKLGTGGLVRAYSDAAVAALEAAGRVERFVTTRLTIEIDFTFFDAIRKLIAELDAAEVDADYSDRVRLTLEIRESMLPKLRAALIEKTNGRVAFVETT